MTRLIALALTAAFTLAGAGVRADCAGVNLMDQMMPGERAAIGARADAVPWPRGNFWTAERQGQSMILAGTYHMDDPRHDPVVAALAPRIEAADALLVEAGPDEEAALLRAMGENPSLMFITEGPSLLERLPRDTWRRLSEALEARGIPSIMAAKFQPWYATVVLAIPPCQLADQQLPKGLDGRLIDAAQAAGVPIRALEAYDTIFSIFGSLTDDQSLAMIESTLALEGQSEDFAVTLAELYFQGDSRLIWELTRLYAYDQPGYTREEIDAEMAMMEEILMTRRNRAWIPVIEEAAAAGPVVVAFGALHLSGEAGVLNLLAANGWQIREMPMPAVP